MQPSLIAPCTSHTHAHDIHAHPLHTAPTFQFFLPNREVPPPCLNRCPVYLREGFTAATGDTAAAVAADTGATVDPDGTVVERWRAGGTRCVCGGGVRREPKDSATEPLRQTGFKMMRAAPQLWHMGQTKATCKKATWRGRDAGYENPTAHDSVQDRDCE